MLVRKCFQNVHEDQETFPLVVFLQSLDLECKTSEMPYR